MTSSTKPIQPINHNHIECVKILIRYFVYITCQVSRWRVDLTTLKAAQTSLFFGFYYASTLKKQVLS